MNAVVLILVCVTIVFGRIGLGPTDQEWGYVTVREGAHMFWWLHKTRAYVTNFTERPLVIWLQGGPGASSTGFGNFAELGPLDPDLNARNYSWIDDVNVLFVDNPVGTGFSYVDFTNKLATTNKEIAEDFLVLLQGFYKTVPDLTNSPLYIFSQSYGGKMAVEIALVLNKAISDKKLDANLIGLGLGNPWISPIDSVLTWSPFLLNLGAIDQNGYKCIQAAAEATKKALEDENYVAATDSWRETEKIIQNVTHGIYSYNVLEKFSAPEFRDKYLYRLPQSKPDLSDEEEIKIEKIMNNQVIEALGLNTTCNLRSDNVFEALFADFMKPVTDAVEMLLNSTDIKVAVYSGQLDLIVDIPGTIKWVDALKFSEKSQWEEAERKIIVVDKIVEGFYKKAGNLAFYWVNRAGHKVPADNPAAMKYILEDVTDGFSQNNNELNKGL